MMRRTKTLLMVVCLFAALVPSRLVRADVAPPSQPPGSNVVPGETTMVQMLYERVVIDLRPPWAEGNNADVTARFTMRNQGTVDERMAVGFPLNNIANMTMEGSTPKLENLIVRVNGQLIPVRYTSDTDWLANQEQGEHILDWAVMDVAFPAGQDVTIEVNYKQPPTYDAPSTQYDYTLFTGAGWYGPIGAGDIILRLPYTVSWGENYWSSERDNNWGGVDSETIVENEVRWHFQDFEPQNYYKDNWSAHVVRPGDWQRVLAARQAVINHQYDAALWKELGDAYSNAAIALGGKTYDSSYSAITAYQQSVTLQPDWAEAHALLAMEYYKAYSDALFYASESNPPDESLQQGALQELSVALALDPANSTALELKEMVEIMWPKSTLPAPTPFQTPTMHPEEMLSPTVTPVSVTAVNTKPERDRDSTATPRPAVPGTKIIVTQTVPLVTAVMSNEEHGAGSPSALTIAVIGMIATFIAGLVIGSLWSTVKKR